MPGLIVGANAIPRWHRDAFVSLYAFEPSGPVAPEILDRYLRLYPGASAGPEAKSLCRLRPVYAGRRAAGTARRSVARPRFSLDELINTKKR